jgi:hypothetical protein
LHDAIAAGRAMIKFAYEDMFRGSPHHVPGASHALMAAAVRHEGDAALESVFCDFIAAPVDEGEVRDYDRRCHALKAAIDPGDWALFEAVRLLWCMPATPEVRQKLVAAGVDPSYFRGLPGPFDEPPVPAPPLPLPAPSSSL